MKTLKTLLSLSVLALLLMNSSCTTVKKFFNKSKVTTDSSSSTTVDSSSVETLTVESKKQKELSSTKAADSIREDITLTITEKTTTDKEGNTVNERTTTQKTKRTSYGVSDSSFIKEVDTTVFNQVKASQSSFNQETKLDKKQVDIRRAKTKVALPWWVCFIGVGLLIYIIIRIFKKYFPNIWLKLISFIK